MSLIERLRNGRDIGYGVVAHCDLPGCMNRIDRGMGYRCGGAKNFVNGSPGCGGYFCSEHQWESKHNCSKPDDMDEDEEDADAAV